MAHNVVISNSRIRIKPLMHKQRPPDIPSSQQQNPPTLSPSPPPSTPALSYTSGRPRRPSTPSPSLGKRPHEGPDGDNGRTCPGNPHTPVKLTPYAPSVNISTQIDPLQFDDASARTSDQEMGAPETGALPDFNTTANNLDWDEQDSLPSRHLETRDNIRFHLGEIH